MMLYGAAAPAGICGIDTEGDAVGMGVGGGATDASGDTGVTGETGFTATNGFAAGVVPLPRRRRRRRELAAWSSAYSNGGRSSGLTSPCGGVADSAAVGVETGAVNCVPTSATGVAGTVEAACSL